MMQYFFGTVPYYLMQSRLNKLTDHVLSSKLESVQRNTKAKICRKHTCIQISLKWCYT